MGPTSIPLMLNHNVLGCHGIGGEDSHGRTNEQCGIREVWAHNMEEEFGTIVQVSSRCNTPYNI